MTDPAGTAPAPLDLVLLCVASFAHPAGALDGEDAIGRVSVEGGADVLDGVLVGWGADESPSWRALHNVARTAALPEAIWSAFVDGADTLPRVWRFDDEIRGAGSVGIIVFVAGPALDQVRDELTGAGATIWTALGPARDYALLRHPSWHGSQ